MKTLAILSLSILLLLIGCDATSDVIASDSATLTIFHSNDLMGYMTPCG
ncbi:hypothetical protein JXA02_05635 [candidate division KSB1 bacterium]|nr:hypothetical protein [candidate division KSB1 bacterium]